MLEQRLLIALLVVAISGGVVMYREVGVIGTAVVAIQDRIKNDGAEHRAEILRLNSLIMNHERRHGRDVE